MRDRLIELLRESENKVQKTLKEKFSLYLSEWIGIYADNLLANGIIVPPCKFNDTVYVIPSKTNRELNIINGFAHLNRVYEQKISEVRIYANNKYLLTTCEGLQSVHCDFYKETWFLTREEAEQALKGGVQE